MLRHIRVAYTTVCKSGRGLVVVSKDRLLLFLLGSQMGSFVMLCWHKMKQLMFHTTRCFRGDENQIFYLHVEGVVLERFCLWSLSSSHSQSFISDWKLQSLFDLSHFWSLSSEWSSLPGSREKRQVNAGHYSAKAHSEDFLESGYPHHRKCYLIPRTRLCPAKKFILVQRLVRNYLDWTVFLVGRAEMRNFSPK